MWKKNFELFPEIKINFRYLKDCILISCFLKNPQLPIILQYIKVSFDTQHIFFSEFLSTAIHLNTSRNSLKNSADFLITQMSLNFKHNDSCLLGNTNH